MKRMFLYGRILFSALAVYQLVKKAYDFERDEGFLSHHNYFEE